MYYLLRNKYFNLENNDKKIPRLILDDFNLLKGLKTKVLVFNS